MNAGILSVRYAKAFLEYTQETGHADRVFHQVNALLKHPEVTPDKLEPELERFVELLVRNRRMEWLRFILRTYERMYYQSKGDQGGPPDLGRAVGGPGAAAHTHAGEEIQLQGGAGVGRGPFAHRRFRGPYR